MEKTRKSTGEEDRKKKHSKRGVMIYVWERLLLLNRWKIFLEISEENRLTKCRQ